MKSVFYQPHNSMGNYNYNIVIYEPCEYAHHFHKNFELVYIIEGAIEAQIDGKKELVEKGEFILILPNSIHSFHTPEHSRVWVGVFSADYISDFVKLIQGKRRVDMTFTCNRVEMEYLDGTLLSEEQQPDILTMKAGLYMICNSCLKTSRWVDQKEMNKDLAHLIIRYVEENFRRNITLREIADYFGYEYHYFSRCFCNLFYMNFKTFVNQYRFDYAKQLIMKTDYDMTQIAMESGFGSLRNFNRIYKDYSKNTPREQRAEAIRVRVPENDLLTNDK